MDLPMASPAAAASSSATARTVARRSLRCTVVRAAQIDEEWHAGRADGHVGEAEAPRSTERGH